MAQREANDHQIVFRFMGPPPGQLDMIQADVIPRAIADGASALIVVPGDSPRLAKELWPTPKRKKCRWSCSADRSRVRKDLHRSRAWIHEPFEASPKRIVATTLEDAKKAGRPPQGTALLLSDKETDQTSADRLAALESAAEAVGLRPVTISYDGTTQGSAKAATLAAIKANPDTLIVLADEGEGLVGASSQCTDLPGGHPGRFPWEATRDFRNSSSTVRTPERGSCFVERRGRRTGQACRARLAQQLDGESDRGASGPRVGIPPRVGRGRVPSQADRLERRRRFVQQADRRRDAATGQTKMPSRKT